MKPLSAGKLRGLMTLADDRGVFKMLAVDQRPPIFKALARHKGRRPDEVGYDEVASVKTLLTRVLAPKASAILIDPVWTHPHALPYIPGRVGLVSTLEDHSFSLHDGERRSHPIAGWSVAKIKRSGACGVKLLVWDRPDTSPETRAHQDALVSNVSEACKRHDLPLILELLVYPKEGEDEDALAYAAAKPELVLDSVRHYADPAFGVDLLKLEFPASLKHCREFCCGAFDGRERPAAYTLSEAQGYLREMDGVAGVPWVLLSAGVGPREFALNLELASQAGASGFLAGRAVWWGALGAYPDMEGVRQRLEQSSLPYLEQISALASLATPWTAHKRYNDGLTLEGAGPDWYSGY